MMHPLHCKEGRETILRAAVRAGLCTTPCPVGHILVVMVDLDESQPVANAEDLRIDLLPCAMSAAPVADLHQRDVPAIMVEVVHRVVRKAQAEHKTPVAVFTRLMGGHIQLTTFQVQLCALQRSGADA